MNEDRRVTAKSIVLPVGFPRIVVLCGSTRFKKEYIEANFKETMKGNIVLSVGLYGHADSKVYTLTEEEKRALDELHFRKIELSDEVFIINPRVPICDGCSKPVEYDPKWGGFACRECGSLQSTNRVVPYIGESTRREIEYATGLGKPIRYLEAMEHDEKEKEG